MSGNSNLIKPTSSLINRLGKYSVKDDVVSFFMTGAGIEFVTDSSSLILDVESNYSKGQEIWLTIEVDGALIQRICLNEGRSTICAFRKVSSGTPRVVRVLRESQLDTYVPVHALRIHSLSSEDDETLNLLEPPNHKYNLEFIGDSITSGEGLNGKVGEMSFVSAFYGYKNNYSLLTADKLDAFYTTTSQSGWGVYCGYNNSMETIIPAIYFDTKINGEELIEDRPDKDVVVISLGTNDYSAFTFEEWVDPSTGTSYKLHLDSDGNMVAEDAKKVIDAGIDFVNKLKDKHPNAKFIWLYGMYGNGLEPALREICEATGTTYVSGADCLPVKDFGSREHPGNNTHAKTSEILIDKIREILG